MPKLNKSDRIAYGIGRVTLKYNDIQLWFFLIFEALMHDALYLAHPTFFSVKSDRGQRDMLRSMATERLRGHPELLKKLGSLIERSNQLGGRRNDVLHAMWSYDRPRVSPTVSLPFHNRLVGKNADSEINTLLSELVVLEREISPFYVDVRETLQTESRNRTRKLMAEAFSAGLRTDPKPKIDAQRRRKARKND